MKRAIATTTLLMIALSTPVYGSGTYGCTVRDRNGNCRGYGGSQTGQPFTGDNVPEGGPSDTQGAGTR